MYTQEELEEAKEFLRRRLDSERSMRRDVERLLEVYAAILLDLYLQNIGNDDISVLIDGLIAALLEDCHTLGVDERTDKRNDILAYMDSELGGDTLEGRINKRCHTFADEVAVVATAGILLHKTRNDILASIVGNFKHPYDNELLKDVRTEIEEGRVSYDYHYFDSPHYGSGTEISSMGALQTITSFAVADAWMDWQYHDAVDRGAKGYYVLRGSSYPCEECNSHTGIFYPIDDSDSKPQYHLNCCCIVVYSYVERV